MPLKARIQDDMKTAMRARDTGRLSAIRLLLAAIKQREVDERIELDDAAVTATIEKMVKQRRDAAAQFDSGNRPELAAGERFEIGILSAYLPAALSSEELDAEIAAVITACAATSPADLGKTMTALKPRLAGRADMAEASRRVRARLGA
ncbi:MAG TPA: GatB/YqeY domain-containing protein [Rhodocyclaceae bacterium]|nr:GatB/YqeY domain-containing protein [Rhodocyclaceae bacterium]